MVTGDFGGFGGDQQPLCDHSVIERLHAGCMQPMGCDVRAMVGDSPTISVDLLPTDCDAPVVRLFLE